MHGEDPRDHLFQRNASYPFPLLERGEGIYVYDTAGKRYIDGAAGAGNVTLGHGRDRIAQVMAEQAASLAYCFSSHFGTQSALDLADRIAALAPGSLNHLYFVSGGSEGVETAFKMARLYHVHRGKTQKQLIISRWRGYHGATLGAMSATGTLLRNPFRPWLADFPHIAPCYPYRCGFAGCEGRCNLSCARELEEAILQAGADNVEAFIAEPVVMAGIAAGVPPPDYFPLIREICDRHDVLFIVDEVITGFGRSGKPFAIEHWDVVPDMIVFGKGVSSGYIPLGGVILQDRIRQVLDASGQSFPHVYTYVNNPVAMKVGLTVLDILEEEQILAHVTEVGDYLQRKARELERHAIVGEVRGMGLMLGVELVQNQGSGEPFPVACGVHRKLNRILMEMGLSVAVTGGSADWTNGDDLRFYPPLIITREQIDATLEILHGGLKELRSELG